MSESRDDLDARLRGLGDGSPYVLPGAAAARRRGDQRTRRRRAAVTGAGVALVAAVAVTTGIASGGGGSDRISPPDVADRPEPTSTTRPERSAAPSAVPTPPPSTTPGAPGQQAPLQDLLLDETAAGRAEPGDWMPGEPVQPPLLDPCAGGTDYPRDTDRTDTAAVSLLTVEEGAGIDVRQTLARYPSASVAADAAAGYERAVRGCPGAAQDSPSFEAGYQVVRSEQSDGGSTVIVRMSQGVIYASYVAIQQRGDVVSVLAVGYGGDGDPGVEAIQPFLPEVAASLAGE